MIDLDVPAFNTWNPISLSTTTPVEISPAFKVLTSSVGDHVEVYPPYDLQGLIATGYVENSTGTVRVTLWNPQSTAVNLGSGSWGVRVRRWFQ